METPIKKNIFTIALLASLSVQASDIWSVVAETGATFTVLPDTARRYTNEFGAQQADAVVMYFNVNGSSRQSLHGVTDCGQRIGSIGSLNPDGSAIGEVFEWRANGSRTMDLLAERICTAARHLKSLTPTN